MKIFSSLYRVMMRWAKSPKAVWYLMAVAFSESSFFIVPPDVMLAPMSLAKPDKAWRYAALTTFMSVLGGLFGYVLGAMFFHVIEPWMIKLGYQATYQLALHWFSVWGFWVVFVAGFSPIPYKVFTIAAGVFGIGLPAFIAASVIGRGGRFFLVAGLMKFGGEPLEYKLHYYIDRIGWATVLLLGAGLSYYYLIR